MMINPQMLIQLMSSNNNPVPILRNMFPPQIVDRALQMLDGKTPQEQERIVRNLAQARGVNINDIFGQFPMP